MPRMRRQPKRKVVAHSIPAWLFELAKRGSKRNLPSDDYPGWDGVEEELRQEGFEINTFVRLDFIGRQREAAIAILKAVRAGSLAVSETCKLDTFEMKELINYLGLPE